MTAEIAVMNTLGIALAADSAVTVTTPTGQKVYNTANKLFRLSDVEPVALMVFNAAAYQAVPWETIIKTYRHDFGHMVFDTLEQYVDDFLEYLREYASLPDTSQQEMLAETEYAIVFAGERAEQWAKEKYEKGDAAPINERLAAKRLLEEAEEVLAQIQTAKPFDGIRSNQVFPTVRSKEFRRHLEDLINKYFDPSVVSEMLISVFVDVAEEIARRGTNAGAESGIVVAGFGREEVFPRLCTANIRSAIDGKLRVRRTGDHSVTEAQSAALIPFAQIDVVQTFMNGLHPRLAQYLGGQVRQLLDAMAKTILDALFAGDADDRKSIEQQIAHGANNASDEMAKEIAQWQRLNISNPVVEAVQHLPLDELAVLAESLVKSTALRRRVSLDPETVGGAVDVAVISKGDGFIWIDRKHYFGAERNSHFFDRQRSMIT